MAGTAENPQGTCREAQARGSGKPVGAVVAAVQVMEHLQGSPVPLRITSIAKSLGLNPSTCFNILRTLVGSEWVAFDPATKGYSLGIAMIRFARMARERTVDVHTALPLLRNAAREHGVTISLWRRISIDRMILILVAVGASRIRIQMDVGQRVPLLLGSAGQVLGGYSRLTESEMREQFKTIRWADGMTFERFLEGVEAARERGWGRDDGSAALQTSSISVPVARIGEAPRLICTATMLTGQLEESAIAKLVRDMRDICVHLETYDLD